MNTIIIGILLIALPLAIYYSFKGGSANNNNNKNNGGGFSKENKEDLDENPKVK